MAKFTTINLKLSAKKRGFFNKYRPIKATKELYLKAVASSILGDKHFEFKNKIIRINNLDEFREDTYNKLKRLNKG